MPDRDSLGALILGRVRLRRSNDVPGAAAEQLLWRIIAFEPPKPAGRPAGVTAGRRAANGLPSTIYEDE